MREGDHLRFETLAFRAPLEMSPENLCAGTRRLTIESGRNRFADHFARHGLSDGMSGPPSSPSHDDEPNSIVTGKT